jgi:hypothetical protein
LTFRKLLRQNTIRSAHANQKFCLGFRSSYRPKCFIATLKEKPANSPNGLIVFACKLGLKGIVSKRKDSTYRSGRSPDWLKMKNCDAPAVKREAEEEWAKRNGDDRQRPDHDLRP